MEAKEEKELNICIPDSIKEQIRNCGAVEDVREPVYRVAKNGVVDELAFISTFEEILNGGLPDMPGRYPRDKVGTYSTSVYLEKAPCEKFIKCLKKGVTTRTKFPHPVIMMGKTTNGLVQRTIEREKDYEDSRHVDWWIYNNEIENVIENFAIV